MNKLSKAQKQNLEIMKDEAKQKLEDLRDYLTELKDEAEEVFYNRSEKWQESEKADSYQNWIDDIDDKSSEVDSIIDELDSLELDEIEQPES